MLAGYFEAPATLQCTLLGRPPAPLPPVTMVFCGMDNLAAMQVRMTHSHHAGSLSYVCVSLGNGATLVALHQAFTFQIHCTG